MRRDSPYIRVEVHSPKSNIIMVDSNHRISHKLQDALDEATFFAAIEKQNKRTPTSPTSSKALSTAFLAAIEKQSILLGFQGPYLQTQPSTLFLLTSATQTT